MLACISHDFFPFLEFQCVAALLQEIRMLLMQYVFYVIKFEWDLIKGLGIIFVLFVGKEKY